MQFEQNFLDKHFWISDNQILYDGCSKDKWITKFSLTLTSDTVMRN